MSTTVKAGWLKDKQGNKFAPKTMSSQVINDDGTLLKDNIQAQLDEISEKVIQANWNQNDETKLDYIKNRPFYEEDPVEMIIAEGTIPSGGMLSTSSSATWLTLGEKYTVIFDNTTYNNLECVLIDGVAGVGSSDFSYTDYPFVFAVQNGTAMAFAGDDNSHSIRVIQYVAEVIPLERKYIANHLDSLAGEKVKGKAYIIDEEEVVAANGAEVFNDYNKNVATGKYSHAEGSDNKATGDYSHAEGIQTTASGHYAHAEGVNVKASGATSHAEGSQTTASGFNSHAEGQHSEATNDCAHAEGFASKATGQYSHAEGDNAIASGQGAHAEGYSTVASGRYSHAEGSSTIASSPRQHVQGKYNIEDTSEKYAHIVGNGTGNYERSNAHTLDWNGNAWFKGKVLVGGTSQDDGSELATQQYVNDSLANVEIDVDSTLSSTSENPVQNKVINAALGNKANQTSLDTHTSNKSNPHGVTASQIGLGNVNNTSDANKPVSTAQQTAIDTALQSAKTYTDGKINALVGEGASTTLDTIGEISAAIEENQDMIDTLNAAIGNKVDKVSGKGLSTNDLTTTLKSNYDTAYSHVSNKNNPHGVTLSQLGVSATAAELNYVDGVTSGIQAQLDGKAASGHKHTVSEITDLTATAAELNYMDGVTSAVQAQLNAKANSSDLSSHTGNKSNPHGVTLSQLGVTATVTELNYMSGVTSKVQTQLDKKANDYSLELYNGTSGNPKPVKFLTVNYSTCGSENGVAIKLGLVSGHGNGSSYAFLEDAIIKVTHTGSVTVDNFKYYGASTGTYDGANRYYGDIFWTIDETNKIVDFYCLMGQYARVQMTPWKRVTYSTGGTITQHTSCTVYSSGTKVWANNSEFALMSDLDSLNSRLTALENSIVTVHSGDTIPLSTLGEDGDLYIVTD